MRRAVLAAFGLLSACGGPPTRGDDPPFNFIVIIADDLGEGDLSCYGHPVLRTPHIDRLAREGVRFERAFLTTSSCSPSRASILTGRYPHNTGAENLHMPRPAEQKTVAQSLRAAGWHCMAAGKWHLGAAERRNWDAIAEGPGADTARNALRLLADRPKGKPFFLWMASVDPHRPYGEKLPEPHDPATVIVPPYLPDHPLIRKDLAHYYDEISRLDLHVGLVLDQLEREEVLDQTFIAFISDNGMPFPRAKITLYDSGIRTPLLIRCPGIAAPGAVQMGLASSIDLAPTMLDLAGVRADGMQGRSLVPMLVHPRIPGRDAAFAEANWHDFDQFSRAVRTEKHLLVWNRDCLKPLWNSVDSIHSGTWQGLMEMERAGKLTPGQRFLFQEPRPRYELYDLEKDPAAFVNVAEDPAYLRVRSDLVHRLDAWRVETKDADRAAIPDGWTREGVPLPHNQPWYDRFMKEGKAAFEKF